MGVQLLIVKPGQQMVLPVAQRHGFGDLVIDVEALQIFIGGVGKTVELINLASRARCIDAALMRVDVEIARLLVKAPAAVELMFKAVAQHPLTLLKPAPLITGVIALARVCRAQVGDRKRVRRRQARGVLRQRIQGEAGFAVGLPGDGRGNQVVFIPGGVRLIVIFRRFTQQAVVPVAVGNLPG